MIVKMISYIYRKVFNMVATVLPVKEKTVLFESFNGKIPSDNPLAIYQAFKAEHNDASWQLYWGVKKQYVNEARACFPEYSILTRFSLKWLWLTARANFWVFNSRMPIWLKKNKQTIYIQTWHGTPLKKLGLDINKVSIPGTDTQSYHHDFIYETRRWDILIAPNTYSKNIFKHAFLYQQSFLEIGYPRNDMLTAKKDDLLYINRMKTNLVGHSKGKVILYAPTWRDNYYISKGNYKFYMPFDLEKVVSLLGENDTLIIRPHYLVGDTIDVSKYDQQVIVCTDEDINKLYLISDILITDYSSVMFDYAHLKRPMLFYAYDFDFYKEELRGFYFDYNHDLPGQIVKDEAGFYPAFNQLLQKTEIEKVYQNKYNDFFDKFCNTNSSNSRIVVERILSETNDKN
ncbi:CDP-glycerol glycerophosphotransferase family protein [Enterococcus sp.]|uniref:CDP-glycerol glycerophosphotransferase family protein n=1 Tax=Enterococcus sp. TaxID=35783 RepID=UPI00289D9C1F|nr:CDP-glycerol glycerophosphotransferase family protein [Enterococcus sp.]